MIKVSILVPVYNVEKYLRECLESLIHQTLPEIEIICINDGSTDNSLNILREFEKKDTRIKVIDKKNTGYGDTMNRGLQQAVGEYIGIVESDDFASCDMFQELYDIGKENNAEVVKSNYFDFSYKNGVKSVIYKEILRDCKYDRVFSSEEDRNIYFVPQQIWSAIYKSDFLNDNHIRFHETPGASYQDISFAFQVWYFSKRIYLTKKAYLHYRIDNPLSSVHSLSKVFCVCDEYNWVEEFLENSPHNIILNYVETAMKFHAYFWSYNRIASEYQYAFLLCIVKELEEAKNRELVKRDYWSEYNWRCAMQIIDNPEEFYHKTSKSKIKSRAMNPYIYGQGLLYTLKQSPHVILYGAGQIGCRVLDALLRHNVDNILNIAVTEQRQNPRSIAGIPVCNIGDLRKFKDESIVLVAVTHVKQIDIMNTLETFEFKNVILMDSELLEVVEKDFQA